MSDLFPLASFYVCLALYTYVMSAPMKANRVRAAVLWPFFWVVVVIALWRRV